MTKDLGRKFCAFWIFVIFTDVAIEIIHKETTVIFGH